MSATPEEIASMLDEIAESMMAQIYDDDLRAAATLIRAQAERARVLEEALNDLVMRLENKIALARDNNMTSYGHSYVLCAGIEACIEASGARAALAKATGAPE